MRKKMLPVQSCFIDTDYSKQTIDECPFIVNHTAEFENIFHGTGNTLCKTATQK